MDYNERLKEHKQSAIDEGKTEFTMSSRSGKDKDKYKYKLIKGEWLNIRSKW